MSRKVTLMVGNIGSGKSTEIRYLLSKSAILSCDISKDDFRMSLAGLAGKEYIHTPQLEEVIHSLAMDMMEALLIIEVSNIYIDETLMSVKDRAPYINLAKKYEYDVGVILFEDQGIDYHVGRRMNDPRGVGREQWERVYTKMAKSFETPTFMEGIDNVVTHNAS